MRSLKVMVGLLALLLVAGACNGDSEDPKPPGPPPPEVPVSLAEWTVAVEAPVGSGEVRFAVRNDGGTVHQLAVYRGGSLAGDAIEGGTLIARTRNIEAGGTLALEAPLEPGQYWLVCPIAGHTASGMSAELTVGT